MKTSSSVHKYGTISGSTATNPAPARPGLFKDNELVFEAQTAESATSQRFRSINRSFRTAVDKSFDMPSFSGKPRAFLHLCLISFSNLFCLFLKTYRLTAILSIVATYMRAIQLAWRRLTSLIQNPLTQRSWCTKRASSKRFRSCSSRRTVKIRAAHPRRTPSLANQLSFSIINGSIQRVMSSWFPLLSSRPNPSTRFNVGRRAPFPPKHQRIM